jgi:predicted nucleic acid-binding protein
VVAALLAWHPAHAVARRALRQVSALPAPVVLETFSVLTRLPAPHRITPADAGRAVGALSLPVLGLPVGAPMDVVASLAAAGLGGGATYDALVAVTAKEHGHTLLTFDRRAGRTYEVIDAPFTVLTAA